MKLHDAARFKGASPCCSTACCCANARHGGSVVGGREGLRSCPRLLRRRPRPQHPNNGNAGPEDIDVSKIRYIDYDADHFPLHNSTYHFIHKRLEYEWENELRVFARITKQAAEASAAGGTDFEMTAKGLFLPINVETLIEGVYIAPQAPAHVEQTVRELLQRLGLTSIPILPSALVSPLSSAPAP
jgi:hypothetical protein